MSMTEAHVILIKPVVLGLHRLPLRDNTVPKLISAERHRLFLPAPFCFKENKLKLAEL